MSLLVFLRFFSNLGPGWLGITIAELLGMDQFRSFRIGVLTALLVGAAGAAQAATLTLAWDSNPDTTTTGYRIEYGTQPGVRPFIIDAGNQTTFQVTGLAEGTAYYFAVRAYNGVGTSAPSIEVSRRVGTPSSVLNDFDGDAKADLIVYRPDSGGWFFRYSSLNYNASSPGYTQWGLSTDKPLGGDFDGDGKIEISVYRPSTGEWFIKTSSTGYQSVGYFKWGLSTDVPLAGDFDGDGRSDLTVYRPSTGEWFIKTSSSGYANVGYFQWGLPSAATPDTPLTGDFDGDGRLDIAVFRPSDGTWYIRYSTRGYSNTHPGIFQWGLATDQPIIGDFDGDGKTDLTVFRPSDGGWYIQRSSIGYNPRTPIYFQWGLSTDKPIASDFDRDGKTDLAVFRPSDGGWYVRYSSLGYSTATWAYFQWGLSTDIPVKP